MKYFNLVFTLILLFFVINSDVSGMVPFDWAAGTPENHGFSPHKLDTLKDSLAQRNTKSLLIIRDDKIVYEWYAPDHGPEKKHFTASLAKSLVGGMSLLLALNDNKIDIDTPACSFIPEWKKDPKKSLITIRQLATHTSGIEDSSPKNIEGWKKMFWERKKKNYTPPVDPFTLSRDNAPVLFTPGTNYQYSNPGMAMLSYAITAAIDNGKYKNVRTYLDERIYTPIGLEQSEWSIGYGVTYEVNGHQLVPNWGGGSFTARAIARIGRLMLKKGNWQGKQLLDSSLVDQVTRYANLPIPDRSIDDALPGTALCWYSNFDGVWERLPRDAFAGSGASNQLLLVIPSMEMIIVRQGGWLGDDTKWNTHWSDYERNLFNPLMDAFIEPPYSYSTDIVNVEFAPVSEIIRKAKGSDNWPLTWADDDNMYTAYGDGWGFSPKVDHKLSLGLCRIKGEPDNFVGINIRSLTGERVGQGKQGEKASGILMIDGILFMFYRNVLDGNSRLCWSNDHGKTWQHAKWVFDKSFGAPTFLNFGKNYNGARDEYVYIYSHDDDSAYNPADGMVLARVHKSNIKDRFAYEFFAGINQQGQPHWSKFVEKRKHVFTHPARCYRSGITYNPGLKKYLWCQIHPYSPHKQGQRFEGGFGIYEADEPWGPWKTVFYTSKWDIGPGDTSSLPTKWMSKNGKICYLVFSGDDCFSVRKVEFRLAE